VPEIPTLFFPGTFASVILGTGMAKHELDPAKLVILTSQALHAVWPPWYEYVPAGQTWHAVSVPSRK
jgi:hypothetical protein